MDTFQSDAAPGDAPFFLFTDHRVDEQGLGWGASWDDGPTAETTRIFEGRVAMMQRLDPTVPSHLLWHSIQHPVPRELVHSSLQIMLRKPEQLHHYEWIVCPSPKPELQPEIYNIVSPEWKTAIESVEPGVHEFFQIDLQFIDALVSDRFVFRNRLAVDDALRPHDRFIPHFHPFGLSWRDGARRDVKPGVEVEKIASGHWVVNFTESRWISGTVIVSRQLASKLAPLLPPYSYLWPLPAWPHGD